MIASFRLFFVLSICTIVAACSSSEGNDSSSKSNCKFGAPTPIFSTELQKVTDQSFSVKGQKGIEKVKFKNGMELELLQAGCDDLFQSFRFSLNADLTGDDQFWILKAGEQFQYLSTLSEKHFSFNLWASVISKGVDLISLGETFEPEPNTFIKIDKIPSDQKTILVVTLESKG